MIQVPQQEMVYLRELKGADYNPRTMPDAGMAKLMASMVEFGFVQPIVARREDGLIMGGHQRVEAFKRVLAQEEDQGDVKVPVIFLEGVSDAKAKALNLALNKISGEWDYDKLAVVLDDLTDLDTKDVELTGFTTDEVSDILGLMAPELVKDGEAMDVDKELSKKPLKFAFEVASMEEADVVKVTLLLHGMTGPKNAAAAFVKAMRAAGPQNVKEESDAGDETAGD